jgi:hypothetical protein
MKLLALIPLILCGCTPRSGTLNHGQIPVIFSDSSEYQAAWDRERRVIYVTSQAGHAWLAHEAIHAKESMGITMHQVLDMVGSVPGYEGDVALARQVAAEGGDWYALYRICGPQAVRHPEILASIKLQLAWGKK